MAAPDHVRTLARYNRWANQRLYETAASVSEADYKRDVGVFFKSLHGTLNHLLVTDRFWMHRLGGRGTPPSRLDEILFETFAPLRAARAAQDAEIVTYVDGLDERALSGEQSCALLSGRVVTQPKWRLLVHLFNHQTHHRGQAHAALTALGLREPQPLDLLMMPQDQD